MYLHVRYLVPESQRNREQGNRIIVFIKVSFTKEYSLTPDYF